ncbi:fumarylacetoacetate hydrolase family protein [uncultured Kushneria sp.]|uniref:fumarylacetoacetate hydrolase family protein n=1 Tax=uncultured Kushneria sp. TaxID=905033 RepID=UPI00262932DC|nr:fumarylacetoacetate hydrolase family protein [uncultured Kushneria sp.]
MQDVDISQCLPKDHEAAALVGRVWRGDGPRIVALRGGELVDITAHVGTMSALLDRDDRLTLAREASGISLGAVKPWLTQSLADSATTPDEHGNRLLAPCDLQVVKACGVTFAVSLLERVIEEQAAGDASKAGDIRARLRELIGQDLSRIVPGSEAAMALRKELMARGQWSPYLEVGIGADAEVFSKAAPMSSIGFGANVGVHAASNWNNPEPEVVLAMDGQGQPRGATLGNDVNLRDVEGRSALLLGKAKDNNGACAIGPFIRLFDDRFTMDTIRQAQVTMRIEGSDDDFVLEGRSDMREISRDPLDLVRQTCGSHHQYPDGFMLFLGTMFSPGEDRDLPGQGFTHHVGDRVSIHTPALGTLINRVDRSDAIAPWQFGLGALMRYLAR